MAYDQYLADRIRLAMKDKHVAFSEKEMFGGIAFMVDAKMCVGVIKNDLMARVGPENYESSLKKSGCKEMNFSGKSLKGYVYVEPAGVDMDEDLLYWIDLCLSHNPLAKSSKKK